MSRFRLSPRLALGAVALMFIAPTALAQDRPSLSRLEEYACVAADERDESYRPIWCEGSCGCLDGEDLSAASSCVQTQGGNVRVQGTESGDAECIGFCAGAMLLCHSDSDCPGGPNSRIFDLIVAPFTQGACVVRDTIGCTDDSDCDTAKGFSCQLVLNATNYCASTSCTTQGVCDTGVQQPAFDRNFAFAPLGDHTPTLCDSGLKYNSTDVAECIAQVEAHLGAGACVICGDGNLDAGEQCDDGNLDAGDGCAPDCTTE